MASYRFCRSDDVPLLVQAYNLCCRPHFPDLPELTVDRFKTWIRRLDLWTSSCMVASAGDDPIGVLLAAKREHANRILCAGVRPGHQRREHGSHLMTSLSQKLAILKPTRLECELDAADATGREFVEACGYRREQQWTEYRAEPTQEAPAGAEWLVPVGVDEPLAAGFLVAGPALPWERDLRSLRNLREELQGVALATDTVQAFALFHDDDETETRRVLACGASEERRAQAGLALVLGAIRAGAARPLTIPGVHADEIDPDVLENAGFSPAGETILYTAEAIPA